MFGIQSKIKKEIIIKVRKKDRALSFSSNSHWRILIIGTIVLVFIIFGINTLFYTQIKKEKITTISPDADSSLETIDREALREALKYFRSKNTSVLSSSKNTEE
ncbi:MAG: putative membrane protein [Flavobacteriaceae bacterium]|jgi:uncharacterized membrane protein